MLDDSVSGVLTLFNKSSDDSFYPCGFSKVDADILARFCVYAEKALPHIVSSHAHATPEVVSPLGLFEKRVEEELNRARRFDKSLVLATVRIAGLKDAVRDDHGVFDGHLMDFIRTKTRNFDIVIRLNPETFAFLFLDTKEKVTRLIGSISDFITEKGPLAAALAQRRAELLYGYATFPNDGDSFAELFTMASDRTRFIRDKAVQKGF